MTHNSKRILLLTASAIAILCWLWRPIQFENDVGWYLACGRYMAQHHAFPRTDVFSWTMAGRPWINHEWLFELIAYGSHRIAGFKGFLLLKILLILSALGLVWRRLRRSGIPEEWAWAFLALIFWASHYGWNARADLVSIVFLTALMNDLTPIRPAQDP